MSAFYAPRLSAVSWLISIAPGADFREESSTPSVGLASGFYIDSPSCGGINVSKN